MTNILHKRCCTKYLGEEWENPQERGPGERAAFSQGPLWPPQVLPLGMYLRGGRAGPLLGPGDLTQGDDRDVQSNVESQHRGLKPQATLREAPGSVPEGTLKISLPSEGLLHTLLWKDMGGLGSICGQAARQILYSLRSIKCFLMSKKKKKKSTKHNWASFLINIRWQISREEF